MTYNDKDGEIITKKCDKGQLVVYLDENSFKKKERVLRKYFTKQYKYLIFDIIPTLKREGKVDGIYEVEFEIDQLFKKVYGPMKLKFSVKDDITVLEDITPEGILMKCHARELPTYKGIPYDNDKDFFKIKILGG